jgi:hypothetical protein
MIDRIELIEHAAFLLDNEALGLRMAHNLDHRNPDWKGEADAKAAHDDMKNTATRLYALANCMQRSDAVLLCLDTLGKIAETNGTIESSSLMDWRRKVKVMAEKAHNQARKAMCQANARGNATQEEG